MKSAITAEWNCTRCGATNRKLVQVGTTDVNDQCVNCHAKHDVKVGERPVRWDARMSA
jgi:hypothetical protein